MNDTHAEFMRRNRGTFDYSGIAPDAELRVIPREIRARRREEALTRTLCAEAFGTLDEAFCNLLSTCDIATLRHVRASARDTLAAQAEVERECHEAMERERVARHVRNTLADCIAALSEDQRNMLAMIAESMRRER
jgi:DNA-binding XRE family transcriptional regulator